MVIPYIATHAWIESLNLTVAQDWRPWFVDGQVAGYGFKVYIKINFVPYKSLYLSHRLLLIVLCRFTMQYTSKKYCLTFATVKARIITI